MLRYNESFHTNPKWDRSVDSINHEWYCHNVGFQMAISLGMSESIIVRLQHVDLNNADEGKRWYDFIGDLIK